MRCFLYMALGMMAIVMPAMVQAATDYNVLNRACRGSDTELDCCRASVKRMELYGYAEADVRNQCPQDFKRDALLCKGSYSWCAPVKAKASAPKPEKH